MTNTIWYEMTGLTEEDSKIILEALNNDLELTIDEMNRVYNEAGTYIADAKETDLGNGILCK